MQFYWSCVHNCAAPDNHKMCNIRSANKLWKIILIRQCADNAEAIMQLRRALCRLHWRRTLVTFWHRGSLPACLPALGAACKCALAKLNNLPCRMTIPIKTLYGIPLKIAIMRLTSFLQGAHWIAWWDLGQTDWSEKRKLSGWDGRLWNTSATASSQCLLITAPRNLEFWLSPSMLYFISSDRSSYS